MEKIARGERKAPGVSNSNACAFNRSQKDSMDQLGTHTFQILSHVPGLVHGVFMRHGGVSAAPYSTLNVSWSIGDSQEAVKENLLRVREYLGIGRLVASKQVHGDTIHVVVEDSLNHEGNGMLLLTPPGDALVTRLQGVGLLIKIADCQAVFLVDPVQKVIANVHSGWRGSVRNVVGKTVRMLADRFGSNPEDLLATVSPSLGPCCGEFRNYRDELPESFWPFQVRPKYFDFWTITCMQLIEAGLRYENIETANRCTVCEVHDFFSYRGEGTTGRMAAVIAWK